MISDGGGVISQLPTLAYQAKPTWEIHFYDVNNDGTLSGVDLSDATAWHAAIDTDFDEDTEPMVRTLATGIDASAAASGIIKIELNSNTTTFKTKIANKDKIQAYFELRGHDADANVIHEVRFKVNALGAVDPQGGEALPVVSGGCTINEVYALLRGALDFQFSEDGTSWHSTQTSDDEYYHFAYPSGQYGSSIKMVNGKDGLGFSILGEYNALSTYIPPTSNISVVYYNGNTYSYINDSMTSGHTPPTSATSDDYWQILLSGKVGNSSSSTDIDLTSYALTTYVNEVSGYLDDKIDALDIPTKTSDLTNDSNFATSAYVNQVSGNLQNAINNIDTSGNGGTSITKTSDLTNDSNFATSAYVDSVSGYLDDKIDALDIPTKTSDLTNDSNFATSAYVNQVSGNLQNAINNIDTSESDDSSGSSSDGNNVIYDFEAYEQYNLDVGTILIPNRNKSLYRGYGKLLSGHIYQLSSIGYWLEDNITEYSPSAQLTNDKYVENDGFSWVIYGFANMGGNSMVGALTPRGSAYLPSYESRGNDYSSEVEGLTFNELSAMPPLLSGNVDGTSIYKSDEYVGPTTYFGIFYGKDTAMLGYTGSWDETSEEYIAYHDNPPILQSAMVLELVDIPSSSEYYSAEYSKYWILNPYGTSISSYNWDYTTAYWDLQFKNNRNDWTSSQSGLCLSKDSRLGTIWQLGPAIKRDKSGAYTEWVDISPWISPINSLSSDYAQLNFRYKALTAQIELLSSMISGNNNSSSSSSNDSSSSSSSEESSSSSSSSSNDSSSSSSSEESSSSSSSSSSITSSILISFDYEEAGTLHYSATFTPYTVDGVQQTKTVGGETYDVYSGTYTCTGTRMNTDTWQEESVNESGTWYLLPVGAVDAEYYEDNPSEGNPTYYWGVGPNLNASTVLYVKIYMLGNENAPDELQNTSTAYTEEVGSISNFSVTISAQ